MSTPENAADIDPTAAAIDPTKVTFGLDTFGDITHDLAGEPLAPAQVIRNVLAEGALEEVLQGLVLAGPRPGGPGRARGPGAVGRARAPRGVLDTE